MPSKPKPCLVCRALNTRAEHAKRNTLSSAITFQQAVGRMPFAKDLAGTLGSYSCIHASMAYPLLYEVLSNLRREAATSRAKNDARRARLDMAEKQRQVTKEVPPDAASHRHTN